MVGSEGTLGIITELTLRLVRHPGSDLVRRLPVSRRSRPPATPPSSTIQSGIPVARIELLDALQMQGVQSPTRNCRCRKRRCCSSSFTARDSGVAEQSERFGEIAAELGGGPFDWATRAGRPHPALAGAPRRLLGGARRLRPGAKRCRHRRLRADLAAGRMRHARRRRDADASRPARADRRPCRRRQFPPARCWSISTTPTKSGARQGLLRTAGRARARRWTAPAPASTASVRAR